MTVVALASLKAAPGVTTAAVVLASTWPGPRRALVVEADPDGGVLAPRYGVSTDPGLVSLSAASRSGTRPGLLGEHSQEIVGGIRVVPGPAAAEQARAALAVGANLPASIADDPDHDSLVDCGRAVPGGPNLGLMAAASLVVLVVRPRLDEIHHLAHGLRRLEAEVRDVGLLLVGEAPYSSAEVEGALGTEVVAVLPDDPATAAVISAGRGRAALVRRSTLWRAGADAARRIHGRAHRSRPPAEPGSVAPAEGALA